MNSAISELRLWLSGLKWVECRLVLQNTFAEQAREHPLFVLDALLKYASHQGKHPWPTWIFRPETSFAPSMNREKQYSLRLIFPGCGDVSQGSEAISCIRKWLDGPKRHFRLIEADPPCVLTGSKILADAEQTFSLQGPADGVTIEVLSPLPFQAKDGWKGKITAAWLGESLIRRVERLFGSMPSDLRKRVAAAWKALILIPWFWNYVVFQHRSKSTGGVRYLNGFCGHLFLEGNLEAALPLLAMGAHCNVGSRLSAGQGALSISPEKPFLDVSLYSDDFWIRSWALLAEHTPNLTPDLPEGIVEKLYKEFENPNPSGFHLRSSDMLLGTGLYRLLSQSLARLDPALCARWKENLPWMPEGSDIPAAVDKLLPACDVLLRSLVRRVTGITPPANVGFTSPQSEEEGVCWPSEPDANPGNGPEKREMEPPPLRRPCYLLKPGAAAVLLDENVCSRYQGAVVGSAPLGHVSMLILQGAGSISLPLVRACGCRNIPIIFCTSSGRYQSMIPPEGFVWRDRSDRQLRHWDRLGEEGRLATGIAIIEAKICNFTSWLSNTASGTNLRKAAAEAISKIRKATTRDIALGIEGSFARLCFTAINSMVAGHGFASSKRLPRQRRDAWNCLLDTASSLVYSRLCVLLTGEGLSPYRGYLHCQHTRYATLAADLQEIFRARTEQWLVGTILDGRIDISWLEKQENTHQWSLTRDAWHSLLEEFEKELGRCQKGCCSTWLELMENQICRIRLFCTGGADLELYKENGWWSINLPFAKNSKTRV